MQVVALGSGASQPLSSTFVCFCGSWLYQHNRCWVYWLFAADLKVAHACSSKATLVGAADHVCDQLQHFVKL